MKTNSTFEQTSPLRGVRIARGLGLREAARQVPMDASQLSRIERGLEGVSVSTLLRLAEVLDLGELVKLLQPYVARRPR